MGVKMELVFSNPKKLYYAGETVSGRLIVTSDETISLRNISVKFQGKAKTSWEEGDDTYAAQQKIFKQIIALYGGSGNYEQLEAGEYSYPFAVILPENIPSSYHCSKGYVHYKVKAKVDRPQRIDPHVEAMLDIISPINLNMNPEYKMALLCETNKQFCCLCCKSGALTIVSKAARRGYVPGDIIDLIVEVDNASTVHINKVHFEFQRVVICYTHKRKKSTKKIESLLKGVLEASAVAPHNSGSWRFKIKIPDVSPPSFLDKCLIMDLNYVVQIKATPLGAHVALTNDMHVVIGTTPLIEDGGFAEFTMPSSYFSAIS